ncbi:MAG: LysE family translocator [Pseudomonadota bacterium]
MAIDAAFALVLATIIMVLIPGPNLALFVANTLRHGWTVGAITVAGTATGIMLQLALVVLGLTALLAVAASALVWVKWVGVGYLIWLGISTWRSDTPDMAASNPAPRRVSGAFLQGLGLSLLNPKTLFFNAAFVPQFIAPEAGFAGFAVPIALYLTVIVIGDLLWVTAAQRAAPALQRFGALRQKLTGGLFMAAGIGLALARVER